MTTYAIGDLHGRFDLLCQAISVIDRHAGDAGGTFVVLGDFVDRGPGSRSIIELLMAGPASPGWHWIVLKGNHEDMMARCCRGHAALAWWIGNGGGQTLMSYGYQQGDFLQPFRDPLNAHLDWLEQLPLLHVDEHRVFVHAGVDPDAALLDQRENELLWKLYDSDDGRGHGDRHVVHGHHQFAEGPILKEGRSDLDTFAWLTGRAAIGVFIDEPGGPSEILWAEGPPA